MFGFNNAEKQKGRTELVEILSSAPNQTTSYGFKIANDDGTTLIEISNSARNQEGAAVAVLETELRKAGAKKGRDYTIIGSDIGVTFENISANVMEKLRGQLSLEKA